MRSVNNCLTRNEQESLTHRLSMNVGNPREENLVPVVSFFQMQSDTDRERENEGLSGRDLAVLTRSRWKGQSGVRCSPWRSAGSPSDKFGASGGCN